MTSLVDPPTAFAPKKDLLAFLKEMHPHRSEPEVLAAINKVRGYLADRANDPELDRKIEAHWSKASKKAWIARRRRSTRT